MKKISILFAASMLLVNGLWADDSFFAEGFGDEGFGDEGSSSAVEINGSLSTSVRSFLTSDSIEALADLDEEADAVEVAAEADLIFTYEGSDFKVVSDFSFTPSLDSGNLDSMVRINEAYGQYFGEKINLEAGLMKVVWGKADEFHVVDVLNNVNYSEFLVPDYLEMMDPELMFKLNVPMGMSSNLEVAYVPVLTADYLPGTDSIWQPKETKIDLPAKLTAIAGMGLTPTALASVDTNTLDYGQAALHFTSSASGFDYGFTYYAGYNKMPTVNFEQDGADMNYWVSYDPMHVFGVEMGYILAGFNLKGEFAYNMTYDFSGDDALIHNNSIRWVGGFDRDIPLGNLNINIQEAGNVILNNDEITNSDIEYSSEDTYTQNLLIVAITDKFINDKLETKLIGFYHFEESDFGVYPRVEYTPVDDFTFGLEGRFFGGDDDTFFGQYKDNNFVEVSLSWNF